MIYYFKFLYVRVCFLVQDESLLFALEADLSISSTSAEVSLHFHCQNSSLSLRLPSFSRPQYRRPDGYPILLLPLRCFKTSSHPLILTFLTFS